MGTVCVRRGGGSTLFLPRPWDLAGVPFLPGWFGAAPAVGAGGCCPEPSAGGCSPQYPGIPLTLPGATRLQRHWSHLYGEAFPGVSISTGTIPRATSSMSRFPNQQTPLETEPGTGAEPAPPPPPPNSSETVAASHPGGQNPPESVPAGDTLLESWGATPPWFSKASAEHRCRGRRVPVTELHPIGDGTLTPSCSYPGSGTASSSAFQTAAWLGTTLGSRCWSPPRRGRAGSCGELAEDAAENSPEDFVLGKEWPSLQLPVAPRSPGAALPCPWDPALSPPLVLTPPWPRSPMRWLWHRSHCCPSHTLHGTTCGHHRLALRRWSSHPCPHCPHLADLSPVYPLQWAINECSELLSPFCVCSWPDHQPRAVPQAPAALAASGFVTRHRGTTPLRCLSPPRPGSGFAARVCV